MNAPDEYWLPSLNAVRVPDGIDDGAVIDHLLEEYDLEIASGLGRSGGRYLADRLYGLLGPPENVEYVLAALEDALGQPAGVLRGRERPKRDRWPTAERFLCVHLSPR